MDHVVEMLGGGVIINSKLVTLSLDFLHLMTYEFTKESETLTRKKLKSLLLFSDRNRVVEFWFTSATKCYPVVWKPQWWPHGI